MKGEFKLLEKVVSKLAAIAHISTEDEKGNEDLNENDLEMMKFYMQSNIQRKDGSQRPSKQADRGSIPRLMKRTNAGALDGLTVGLASVKQKVPADVVASL